MRKRGLTALWAMILVLCVALAVVSGHVVKAGMPIGSADNIPASTSTPEVEESLTLDWNIEQPSSSRQIRPKLAYNHSGDEIYMVYEDGRNDPNGQVEGYGFAYNSDLFGQRYDTFGNAVGAEIDVAVDGEYENSGRYDNEQWASVLHDPDRNQYVIAHMTLPDSVLEAGDLKTTTCYDVDMVGGPPDIAWYTPPPDLRSPWNQPYNWSCQQEPELGYISADVYVAVWHEARERYEEIDGVLVAKDIFAQVVANGQPLIEQSFLVSRSESGGRLGNYQENPDIAGQGEKWLVVWEDGRADSEESTTGYRDVYARFLSYTAEDGLSTEVEVEIAVGVEGETMMTLPRVAYLPERDQFVLVWTRVQNYTDTTSNSADLMMAVLNDQGEFLIAPRVIPGTTLTSGRPAQQGHTHDIACALAQCVLVYRKGNSTQNGFANMATAADWLFDREIALDTLLGHHTYFQVVSGAAADGGVQFYSAYTLSNRIRLARLTAQLASGEIPPGTPTPAATRTSTPTPTSTSTPSPTPTLTPTPTPSPTATSTPTPTATATGTPSPTSTATSTPTPTPTNTPTPTPLPTSTPTATSTPTPSPTPTATPKQRDLLFFPLYYLPGRGHR